MHINFFGHSPRATLRSLQALQTTPEVYESLTSSHPPSITRSTSSSNVIVHENFSDRNQSKGTLRGIYKDRLEWIGYFLDKPAEKAITPIIYTIDKSKNFYCLDQSQLSLLIATVSNMIDMRSLVVQASVEQSRIENYNLKINSIAYLEPIVEIILDEFLNSASQLTSNKKKCWTWSDWTYIN